MVIGVGRRIERGDGTPCRLVSWRRSHFSILGQPVTTGPEEIEKRAAAEAAAELVPDGAKVGLGSGSTVAYLLPALAARGLELRCVATSQATESAARELGLVLEPLDALGGLDIAIDGADQISPDRWLVKGGG